MALKELSRAARFLAKPDEREAHESIRSFTTSLYKEAIESATPTLVDFWAGWCQPCFQLAPRLAELQEEFEGRIQIGKVNMARELELVQGLGVKSLPTLILYKEGVEQARFPPEPIADLREAIMRITGPK